jgi:serine/threonine protein kinase
MPKSTEPTHAKVNFSGELHEIDCSSPATTDLRSPATWSSGVAAGGSSPLTINCERKACTESDDTGWEDRRTMLRTNYADALHTEDEEGYEEEDPEEKKEMQERRALLMQALKSKKGRKRFIEWLYKIADTSHTDRVTLDQLVVFLKAIRADGINPESFVDPAEDYHDAGGETKGGKSPKQRGVDYSLDRSHPQYLRDVAERVMWRYNDSKTGALSREEFMQLATMVEREYEFSDNNYSGADMIGPYCFKRTLGRGAEGVVKLALNMQTGEKKAIKIIKKGNIAEMSRVDIEIEVMVMLNHPAVVSVNEVLETESNMFLVMEYCAGGHLEDYISPTRPMSEAAARFYFSQLIGGLLYCHEKCVAHRDLRIENLMLDNRGNLKITDFGHAGIFQQGWDMFQTMLVGSVSHLAPEQVTGSVYSGEKIDMWSVGIILYIMVCGTAPFQGDSPEELLDNIRLVKYIRPHEGISSGCVRIIEHTLQLDQQTRPSCLQMKEEQWLVGPKEKLVLAHGEFMVVEKVASTKHFMDELRKFLADNDTTVADKKTTSFDEESGAQHDDEVEANVRTVDDEEDSESHFAGMRPINVTVLHCVHDIRRVVFKVVVTMMSKDSGKSDLMPVIAFDLQSGDAAIFQRVLRRVRGAYAADGRLCAASTTSVPMAVVDTTDEGAAPLVRFAEGSGLNFSYSGRAILRGVTGDAFFLRKSSSIASLHMLGSGGSMPVEPGS